MIREVAEFTVKEGTDEAFIAAVGKAVPIFKAAKGCRSMKLERVIERPRVYRLMVLWDTLEDHLEGFRNSQGFQDWRGLVGEFFDGPANVDHGEVAVEGF